MSHLLPFSVRLFFSVSGKHSAMRLQICRLERYSQGTALIPLQLKPSVSDYHSPFNVRSLLGKTSSTYLVKWAVWPKESGGGIELLCSSEMPCSGLPFCLSFVLYRCQNLKGVCEVVKSVTYIYFSVGKCNVFPHCTSLNSSVPCYRNLGFS